jgi:hypothetical protein
MLQKVCTSFVTLLVSTSCGRWTWYTGTALSVGIEPTSTTQNRTRSQQRLFEYKVDLLFLTLASVNELSGTSFAMHASRINFSSTLTSTANVTLKIRASWQLGHYAHEIKAQRSCYLIDWHNKTIEFQQKQLTVTVQYIRWYCVCSVV